MPDPLRIRAVNTAVESENKIHDDRVAAQYGFRGGLVPGVTVYGYLAAAVLDRFGEPWLGRGAMDVRFHQPIYEGEEAIVTIDPDTAGRVRVNIGANGIHCASAVAWLHEPHDQPAPTLPEQVSRDLAHHQPPVRRAPTLESLAPGTVLGSLWQPLDLAQSRMSAPLDPAIVASSIGSGRFAHPAILLALANEIFVKNYQLGPWIHVSSEVRKFSAARDGERLYTSAKVEDRFERKGHEFVVLGVVIAAVVIEGKERAGWRIVEQVRHTAIWRPRAAQ